MKKFLIAVMAALVLAVPAYANGPDSAEAQQQQFVEELQQNFDSVVNKISEDVTNTCKDLLDEDVAYQTCLTGSRDSTMLYYLMMNDQVHLKVIQQMMQRIEELEKKMIGI